MNTETHRFSFEGSTTMLADHLTSEHGLTPDAVSDLRGGLTQGHWVALDDLHKQAHRVQQPRPTIKFAKTADATARTKKLFRDQNLPVEAAYSRYIDCGMRFRTRISLGRGVSEEDRERAVSVLKTAGYDNVVIDTDVLNTINAYSGLTSGESNNPTAELARRALVEQVPESWSDTEVSAMSDGEAIATAVGAGVLRG